MNLTKRQQFQLQFWNKFHGIEKPTVLAFLRAQPLLWWVMLVLLIVSFVVYEIVYSNLDFVSGLMFATLLFNVVMYCRFRRDWVLIDYCLNWEIIKQAQQNAPPDARNDGARR